MIINNYFILQGDYESPVRRGLDDAGERPNHQKVIIPRQFANEVKALCNYSGIEVLSPGTMIRMSLQEILDIIPKNRKRIDSFKTLINFLKNELDVTLQLTSKKTRCDGSGNE